jgi:hypothetical protein
VRRRPPPQRANSAAASTRASAALAAVNTRLRRHSCRWRLTPHDDVAAFRRRADPPDARRGPQAAVARETSGRRRIPARTAPETGVRIPRHGSGGSSPAGRRPSCVLHRARARTVLVAAQRRRHRSESPTLGHLEGSDSRNDSCPCEGRRLLPMGGHGRGDPRLTSSLDATVSVRRADWSHAKSDRIRPEERFRW